MKIAFLALGSNLGDRLENLRFAARRLEAGGVCVAARSKIYRTQSVETGGGPEFLNAVLRIETELSAHKLLELCQRVEVEAGREMCRPGQHREGARALDVDILLFGEDVYTSPLLEVPHPRALRRNFVLMPLLDVLEGGTIEETEHTF